MYSQCSHNIHTEIIILVLRCVLSKHLLTKMTTGDDRETVVCVPAYDRISSTRNKRLRTHNLT
jgi:hypothetical protein